MYGCLVEFNERSTKYCRRTDFASCSHVRIKGVCGHVLMNSEPSIPSTHGTQKTLCLQGRMGSDLSVSNQHRQTQTVVLDTQSLFCNIMLEESAQVSILNFPATWELPDGCYRSIRIVPCGHTFHCSALIWHMMRNDMRCPVCRAGPYILLDIEASLPPEVRAVFCEYSAGHVTSSSESEDESASDTVSSSSWEMESESSSPDRSSSSAWDLRPHGWMQTLCLLNNTQNIRVVVQIGFSGAKLDEVTYEGYANRVNYDGDAALTRITQMQYQVQGQLRRRVCAFLRHCRQQQKRPWIRVGIALHLGKFNSLPSVLAFSKPICLSSMNAQPDAELWNIMRCNALRDNGEEITETVMGMALVNTNELALQMQWQWMLEHARYVAE